MSGFFYERTEEFEPFVVAGADELLGMELDGYDIVGLEAFDEAIRAEC